MSKTKHNVVIRTDVCKSCGLCVEFCRKSVLQTSDKLNKNGYYYVEPVEGAECSGCMQCVTICPDLAIEVYSE